MEKIKNFIKPIYKKIFPDLVYYFKKEISGCESILDLGCGFHSVVQHCNLPLKVGVELFDPYIEESKKKGLHHQYIKEDVTKVDFKPKSFDAVIMIDVLEHLTKEDGQKMLKKMENWAKKKVIVFTPNGFVDQDEYDHNHLQNHISGWSVKELEGAGFKVCGIAGYKKLRGHLASIKYRPVIFWLMISGLTQVVTLHYPNLAFQLYAVKDIKS